RGGATILQAREQRAWHPLSPGHLAASAPAGWPIGARQGRAAAGVADAQTQARGNRSSYFLEPLLRAPVRAFSRRLLDRWERTMPDPRHEPETLLANVLHEVRSATAQVDQRDASTRSRLSVLENSVNDLLRRAGRPSGGNGHDTDELAQAIEM